MKLELLWLVGGKPTTYRTFVAQICEDGEAEVRRAYTAPNKIKGALDGFAEARETLDPDDLKGMLRGANRDAEEARERGDPDHYWYWRMRAAQIEWVAQVVSAYLKVCEKPVVVDPSHKAMLRWNIIVTRNAFRS